MAVLIVFLSTVLSADDRETLLERLAGLTVVSSVAFEETHQNAFFKQPQISHGVLAFDIETAVMTKTIERPDSMQLTVSAEQVSIMENGETRTVELASMAFAAQIFGALRALLLADLATIERFFEAQYSDDGPSKWSLQLQPRSGDLKDEVESIDMVVIDDRIVSIKTAFNNGDWQQLRLLHGTDSGSQSTDGNKGE